VTVALLPLPVLPAGGCGATTATAI
jgi:hypothetical protein